MANPKEALPAWKLISIPWTALKDLLRSREKLLIKYYRDWAHSLGASHQDLTTLEEARQQLLMALPQESQVSESDLKAEELRIVRVSRLISLWLVFWLLIVPLLFIAFLATTIPPRIWQKKRTSGK